MPVFQCFEVPVFFFSAFEAGLFPPIVWIVELVVAGPLK